ncbi:MAG: glycosyltransferase [Ignavibacteriaceae bacterium]
MKKKLLALCYRPPEPGNAQNSQGQYFILQSAQKFFDIQILSFNPTAYSKDSNSFFIAIFSKIAKIVKLILLGRSPRLSHYWDKNFFNSYQKILNEFKPDYLYIDHILMMQYPLKLFPKSKIWLYNEESQLYIKKYKLRKNLIELVKNYRLDYFEKKSLYHSDKTFFITREESSYVENLGFNSVKTMPYAIDDKYFSYNWNPNQETFSLLFIGDYSHQPNKEAANLICKKLYPAIKNLQIKIILVGRNLDKIKKYLNTEITSYENVEDVRKFYRECTLFVAPIFSGAGMRIKILEAASCGIPVLMTPLANLGVNMENSKEAFIEKDISGMIKSIRKIYASDRTDLVNVSINANNKVKLQFGLSKMNRLYEEVFSDLS